MRRLPFDKLATNVLDTAMSTYRPHTFFQRGESVSRARVSYSIVSCMRNTTSFARAKNSWQHTWNQWERIHGEFREINKTLMLI